MPDRLPVTAENETAEQQFIEAFMATAAALKLDPLRMREALLSTLSPRWQDGLPTNLSLAEMRCLMLENETLHEALKRSREDARRASAPTSRAATAAHLNAPTARAQPEAGRGELHFYPQSSNHFPAQIIGTRNGLMLLRAFIDRELRGDHVVENREFVDCAGKCYDVQVRLATPTWFGLLPAPYQGATWMEHEASAFASVMNGEARTTKPEEFEAAQ